MNDRCVAPTVNSGVTDSEFARLLDEIVTQDVYAAAKTLRSINAFKRLRAQQGRCSN